jgi:hypothetical protein
VQGTVARSFSGWAPCAYGASETGDMPDVEGLFERLDKQK